MSVINFSAWKWWQAEKEKSADSLRDVRFGFSNLVANDGNQVTRLTFKVPNTGAGHYKIHLAQVGRINKSDTSKFKAVSYSFSREPDACINFGRGSEALGGFKFKVENDLNTLEAEGDYNMLPGETLYLWLYAGGKNREYDAIYKFNHVSDSYQYIELTGVGGGIARLSSGSGEFDMMATPYVYRDSNWQSMVPFIRNDGDWRTTS